jgi:hypothetical protein
MQGSITHRRRVESKSKLDKRNKHTSNSSNQDGGGWAKEDLEESLHSPVLGHEHEEENDPGISPTEGEMKNATLMTIAATRQYQHWETFTARLLRHGYWSRLGDLAKSLNALPEDIAIIYDRIQKNMTYKMDKETRLQYYKEFTRTALGSAVLRFNEVETLIDRLKLADHINRVELFNLMNSKLEAVQKGSDGNEFFDFELFASITCDLYDERTKMNEVLPTRTPSHKTHCSLWLGPQYSPTAP